MKLTIYYLTNQEKVPDGEYFLLEPRYPHNVNLGWKTYKLVVRNGFLIDESYSCEYPSGQESFRRAVRDTADEGAREIFLSSMYLKQTSSMIQTLGDELVLDISRIDEVIRLPSRDHLRR